MDVVVPVISAVTALLGAVALVVKAVRASNRDVWLEVRRLRKWRRQGEKVIQLHALHLIDLGKEPSADIVRAEEVLEKLGAELDGGPVE